MINGRPGGSVRQRLTGHDQNLGSNTGHNLWSINVSSFLSLEKQLGAVDPETAYNSTYTCSLYK